MAITTSIWVRWTLQIDVRLERRMTWNVEMKFLELVNKNFRTITGGVLIYYNSLIILLQIYKQTKIQNGFTYRSGVRNLRSIGLNMLFVNLFGDAFSGVQVI
jgi:hypothetical protein